MPFLPRVRSLVRNWSRRRHVERELEAEVTACLDQLIEEKVASGMAPREALRAARIELGGVEQTKRGVREVRAAPPWRRSGRTLLRRPGCAAARIHGGRGDHPGLGIGANTAIFSLVNALLLRPLPADRPHELVALYTSDYSGPLHGASSYPDYARFRDEGDVLAGLVAYQPTPFSLSSDDVGSASGRSERVYGELVSRDYFSMLGIVPQLGRGFHPHEDRTPDTHPVAILSDGLWRRLFAGDPEVLGRSVRLNGHPFTVVGVAPPHFTGLIRGFEAELWVPLMMQSRAMPGSSDLTERGSRSLLIMGRLRPGVTIEQAQSRFDAVAASLHETHRDSWTECATSRAPSRSWPRAARACFAGRGPVVLFVALL